MKKHPSVISILLRQRPTLGGQLADLLRAMVQRGEFARHLPPERELADRFGVSRPTLRLALAQLRREGFLRVRHGIRTQIVRRPQPGRAVPATGIVNFLVPAYPVYSNTDNALMMEAIERRLVSNGLRLRVIADPRHQSGAYARHMPRIAAENPADCWILRSVNAEIVRWFADSGLPAVLLASPFPGIDLPAVDLDHCATARHAVGRFVALGHRRIVLLSGDRKRSGEIETEKGFIEGRLLHGLAPEQCAIVRFDGSVPDLSHTLTALFKNREKPSALLADGSMESMTILTWLLKNGLRVPEDVSLVCRDWDTVHDYTVPLVTCYRYNRDVLVNRVCRWIFRLARGEPVPRKAMPVLTQFDRGETLASPPAAG
jgi:LacI family transcriptional regulator